MKYAQCLVDVKNLGTRTFSYLIPQNLKEKIKIGQAVLVPFGYRKQSIIAFVTGFSDYLEEGIKAKEIEKIIDYRCVFTLDYLKILDWTANYYCCDINTVIQAAIPMKFLKENSGKIKKEKTQKYIKLITPAINSESFFSPPPCPPPSRGRGWEGGCPTLDFCRNNKSFEGANSRQLQILQKLNELGETSLIEFEKEVKTSRATILKLQEKGFVEIIEKTIYRNPLSVFKNIKKDNFPKLSDEQQRAFNIISKKIDEKQIEPVLLNGVTGSGKTEIYFNAIQKVLDNGRNVLFLAPEIALASQLTLRLIQRFTPDEIAIWHSSISEGEKFDVWNKLREDKIRIIIGARSCVFAPLKNIGLIIIDEEHENTYKQTMPAPRYDARLVAEKICEFNNASIIKGSATPDISSYYKALNTGNLITLGNRFNDANMPKVSVVDMKEEFYKGNKSFFSNTLINMINETIDNKKQVILLMNRRGFYTYVQCKSCGEVIKCPNCDIPLVYHSSDKTLKCHWCDTVKKVVEVCPNCSSHEIEMSGAGIQRIENMVQKLFPNAKIARIDSDVLTKKTEYIDILERFQNGEIDILLGTQIIAKGLDNKNVTLVGVVDSDISFSLPDYRAGERGFQLLMQVAGRSGRGADEGRVIFQTYNPELYAIQNAKAQDYISFYNEEISRRENFEYPPFSQIIKIVITSTDEMNALVCADMIAEKLIERINAMNLSEYINIKGAMKCIMYKINSEYRFQIIIKNKMAKRGQHLISTFIKNTKVSDDIKLIIDIDPIDII